VTLPPGQHRIAGFPRFGTHLHRSPPAVPARPQLAVTGAVTQPIELPLADLAGLPRRELTADFHCVAGWSATGLHWEGVAFADFYREVIAPALDPAAAVTHVAFRGLDRYRSVMTLEDALDDDVLLAEHLDGRALDPDHGAPLRLVSPKQYGFVNTKHLCRIEVRTAAPRPFGWTPLIQGHARARVWEEERHRYLPATPLRPVYRLLIAPTRWLSARGSRTVNSQEADR
jgi:DMSO/TMAO reductase YedYZ molybdopterin-dependent catalytic subunit